MFLELTKELATERCSHRPGHFMPASLVDSQFATLEPPYGEDRTLVVDATKSIETIGAEAATWWDRFANPICQRSHRLLILDPA